MHLLCYCMDKEGRHDDPKRIHFKQGKHEKALQDFLIENVEKHHEIRVTDISDNIVLHVVDQTLVFPVPFHGDPQNKWNSELKRFEDPKKQIGEA
jgi:hypothetical protein